MNNQLASINAKPILEKNRKLGNQKISPVGSVSKGYQTQEGGLTPRQNDDAGFNPMPTNSASSFDPQPNEDAGFTPPPGVEVSIPEGRGTVFHGGSPNPPTTQPYYPPFELNTPTNGGINPELPDGSRYYDEQEGYQTTQPYYGDAVNNEKTSRPDQGLAQPELGRSLQPVETQPVGAVPELNQQPLERTLRPVEVQPSGLASPIAQTVNDGDLVSNRLTQLLDENGKYIQLARTGAAQTAARRGLTNSSIAAGAGENAAIRNALPIAQQDANTSFSANTNTVNSKNQFSQNQQMQNFNLARDRSNAGYTQDNMLLQGDINEQTQARDQNNALARAEQGQGFNLQRDSINAGYTQDNMLLQADINEQTQQRDLANQLMTLDRQGFIQARRDSLLQGFGSLNIDQNHRNNLEQIAANFINTQEANRFQMAAQYQSQYLQSSTQLQQSWSEEIQAIYNNPEMTPAQQAAAVDSATARFRNQQDVLATLYSEMGGWNVVTEQFPQSDDQIQAQEDRQADPIYDSPQPYGGTGGGQNPYTPGTTDYEEWESNYGGGDSPP